MREATVNRDDDDRNAAAVPIAGAVHGARAKAGGGSETVTGDQDGGGDAACWLGLVCPGCGAMRETGRDSDGEACWRCG
ncbi:hypothetical protein GCM10011490_01530 [Pseudoclavibacter endophyticus]|nr:hypothetical protein GCM10011490_01530 [Pseudoclavibacter endophyticus]